ncbi:MAG: hypothetical protein A3H27_07800 [Acidobacteria bacterium RIFCSPLOWO2_02_FULL_59_13]|nr:MAG: hypothetical protein A3H27_07800 [Acidobacteria bacterium RIFCSPLOWO2_02_FULL_59_13]
MKLKNFVNTMMLAAVAMLVCVPLWAQRPGRPGPGMGPGPGMMRYDTATEVTLKGTIDEVNEVDCPECLRGTKGVHITLKSGDQKYEVHLGPTSFLADQKFTVAENDEIEVVGSKIKLGDSEVVLGREVKKGDATLVLRDKQGIPRWSMGPGRR